MKRAARSCVVLCWGGGVALLTANLNVNAVTPMPSGVDAHTFANVEDFRVRHVALDLTADFATRSLEGFADLSVARVKPAARSITLDTRDLDVQAVHLLQSAAPPIPLSFKLGEAKAPLGQPLYIKLPAKLATSKDAENLILRIKYATRPEASGLQWLTPAQTAGKKQPFLFTQSQAIHARSWIPLQDTPQVRQTYSATVRVPAGLRALMSAAQVKDRGPSSAAPTHTYRFTMPQAIPSYLIALSVGELEFRATGPRTGVYAEPTVIGAAAQEFADLEQMLVTGERLYGPYRWERYDLLILPPAFPFGGMENPRLSFITPTVIAGDRSLVALIAHELAHSWSGNLVTNATWRDLWLNEGFTVYFERRIVEALYGERRAAMEDVLGLQSLQAELKELKLEDRILAIDLRGRDPDEVFSDVPYEKGKLFLAWLESRVGRERLDAFLRAYFDHFAFQSITTEQFLDYLRSRLSVPERELQAWIFEPDLPSFAILPRSDAFTRVDEARKDWLAGKLPASRLPARHWSTHEWLHFLDNLPEKLSGTQLQQLDGAFKLTAVKNSEIAHSWLKIAIRNHYEPAYARLENYLLTIGRRKLIRPLYDELMKTPEGAERARKIYAQARSGYHPIAVATLDQIVKPAAAAGTPASPAATL